MYTINRGLLKAKLVSVGKTMDGLAADIGLERTTFYRRLRNATLTVGDVHKIIEVLHLTAQETIEIFFAPKVA